MEMEIWVSQKHVFLSTLKRDSDMARQIGDFPK